MIVIQPTCSDVKKTERLQSVLDYALQGIEHERITRLGNFHGLQGKRILFAVTQGESGINLEYYRYLKEMRLSSGMMEGCVGGLIMDGNSELYTKSLARELAFTANQAGCTFPGRPLVEGTASLTNFTVQAKNLSTDNLGAYFEAARTLVHEVKDYKRIKKAEPNILALHASNFKTSNTSMLWNLVKEQLSGCSITEISLRNGAVQDCGGCPYTMCMHFSKDASCYYGGVIAEQVYPAVQDCDALVLLCPNYNDAVSANISAFINRLTALFRKNRFYEKRVFAIVVSGYSGSDIVAQQVISSLNMNKSFALPGRFAMLETANDPGSILQSRGISERASQFAIRILDELKE